MRYLMKYNESIMKVLYTLPNEELEEKLEWLRVEQKEIQEEITSINKILTERKESEELEYSKKLPSSIFDLNKNQFEWVFEHHHGKTPEHYKIAQKYISQLKGLHQVGFNPNTNQFYFSISTSYYMNDPEDEFLLKEDGVESIQFLVDNLKKNNGYVEFGVTFSFKDGYNHKVQIGDEIKYSNYRTNKFESIEKLLNYIVSSDLNSKDDVDW